MKIQISLDKVSSPIMFNNVQAFIMNNKEGLQIIGINYKKFFPLEIIRSLRVLDDNLLT